MPRLPAADVLAEVEWLLSFGIHPELIATQLGRTVSSIEKLARNHDRPDIGNPFQKAASARRRAL